MSHLSTENMEHLEGRDGWAIFGRWPLMIRQFGRGLAASVEWNVGTRTWVAKLLNCGHWTVCPEGDPCLSEALDWCEEQARAALERREKRRKQRKECPR